MKGIKKTSSMVLSVLGFIGTVGDTTENCLGWFYKPEKPKELK